MADAARRPGFRCPDCLKGQLHELDTSAAQLECDRCGQLYLYTLVEIDDAYE